MIFKRTINPGSLPKGKNRNTRLWRGVEVSENIWGKGPRGPVVTAHVLNTMTRFYDRTPFHRVLLKLAELESKWL